MLLSDVALRREWGLALPSVAIRDMSPLIGHSLSSEGLLRPLRGHHDIQSWLFDPVRPNYQITRIKSGRSVLLFVCLFALRLKPLPDERERSNISHWIFSLVITHSLYIMPPHPSRKDVLEQCRCCR